MADEVNQYAFDGGDTEPETASIIKERNTALQDLSDKYRDVHQKVQEARQEGYDAAVEAENKVYEDKPELVSGEPVATPPPEPEATGTAAVRQRKVAEVESPPPTGQ